MIDVLLVYPRLGNYDSLLCDPPLSLIYAAVESVKRGYSVKILDLRICQGEWRDVLREYLDQGVLLVGVSVMTGLPLLNARSVARFVKQYSAGTPVVFGGPHVTVLPNTIEEDFVDYLIRGYGSLPLAQLIEALKGKKELHDVYSLSFVRDGKVIHNSRPAEHEIAHFRELPYGLVDIMSKRYSRSYMGGRMFPIFSAVGCPYRCSFCVHPTIYKVINGPKWIPMEEDEVIDHMAYVIEKYDSRHICFMDDTSFPDLKRMERIFNRIIERKFNIHLEFRGARINEIHKMSDEFLALMVKAGGRVLMVGCESASAKVLASMQKGITKEQIIEVNRKLARFPELTPHYNFIYGAPGETYEDLLETKDVVLQLIQENPQALFGYGGDWKPIPGTRMTDMAAEKYPDFSVPQSYDEWIEMDSTDSLSKITHCWYTRRHNNLIKLMQVSSFVIDNKIQRLFGEKSGFGYVFIRLMARIYKPIALFRLRHNIHHFMLEYTIWFFLAKKISFILGSRKDHD